MKYLHIYFLSLALMISFDLNASKYDKESASDLYKKATKQLKEEDYKSALKTLKKYTKSKKKDADGWTLLAFTNRKLENYSEAESLYTKALNLDPDNKIAIEYHFADSKPDLLEELVNKLKKSSFHITTRELFSDIGFLFATRK